MRRMRAALLVVCLALVAGCGREAKSAANLPATLGYVPRDAFVVAVAPTPLEGASCGASRPRSRGSRDGCG
jgi:hypothetical protein